MERSSMDKIERFKEKQRARNKRVWYCGTEKRQRADKCDGHSWERHGCGWRYEASGTAGKSKRARKDARRKGKPRREFVRRFSFETFTPVEETR